MEESILRSTKKNLGLDPDYEVFDIDIITHINSTFSTLNQLGIGPEDGFSIQDDVAEWSDFLGEVDPDKINSVKTYVYLKVRLIFDPPSTSYTLTAFQNQVEEFEWRLNTVREDSAWVDPDPPLVVIEDE